MKPDNAPPPLPERVRMPLRVVSVFVGYLIYRVMQPPLVGAALLGIGFVVLTWAIIEKFTTFRRDRVSMLLAGQVILGLGLLAVGALVSFR